MNQHVFVFDSPQSHCTLLCLWKPKMSRMLMYLRDWGPHGPMDIHPVSHASATSFASKKVRQDTVAPQCLSTGWRVEIGSDPNRSLPKTFQNPLPSQASRWRSSGCACAKMGKGQCSGRKRCDPSVVETHMSKNTYSTERVTCGYFQYESVLALVKRGISERTLLTESVPDLWWRYNVMLLSLLLIPTSR